MNSTLSFVRVGEAGAFVVATAGAGGALGASAADKICEADKQAKAVQNWAMNFM